MTGGSALASPRTPPVRARCGLRRDGRGRHLGGGADAGGGAGPVLPCHKPRLRGLLVMTGPGRRAGVPRGVTTRLALPCHTARCGGLLRGCTGALVAAVVTGARFAGPAWPPPVLPRPVTARDGPGRRIWDAGRWYACGAAGAIAGGPAFPCHTARAGAGRRACGRHAGAAVPRGVTTRLGPPCQSARAGTLRGTWTGGRRYAVTTGAIACGAAPPCQIARAGP